MNRIVATLMSSVVLTAVICPVASADVLYLAGADHGASSSYAFVGSIVPLPGNTLGSGFGVRLWGDYLSYEYKAGSSNVQGAGWGAEVAGMYQFSGAWGWSNLSAGTRYRDTKFSPDDLNNRARGGHIYLTLQTDGGYNVDPNWRLRGIASYTSTVTGYFLQPAIDRAIFETMRLGLDATFQGDKNYKQVSGGANVSIAIDDRRSLGLRAGFTTSSAKSGVYAGLSFLFTGS